MGEGDEHTFNNPSDKWEYPSPGTSQESYLIKICEEHQ